MLGASHRGYGIALGAGAIVGGMVCATMALFSSTTGLLLFPLAAAQMGVIPAKRFKPSARRNTWRNRRSLVHIAVAACLLLPAVAFRLDQQVSADPIVLQSLDSSLEPIDLTLNPAVAANPGQRMPITLSLAWHYTRQVFWPNLDYNHIPNELPTWSDKSTWLGLAVVITVAVGLLITLGRRHWLCIAFMLALGQGLMVSHLWLTTHWYASNLFMAPFILGAVVPLSWLIDQATREQRTINRATRDSTRKRAVAVVPCLVIVVVMTYQVLQINGMWFSKQRLMAGNLSRQDNNPVAMYLYGASLIEVQWYDGAHDWLDLARQFRPDSLQILGKLAMLEELRFRPKVACDHYERMVLLQPDYWPAYVRLADLAMEQDDLEEAQKHIDTARLYHPTDSEVMYYHARLANLQGDPHEALKRYRALLDRYPYHSLGRRDLVELENIDQEAPLDE